MAIGLEFTAPTLAAARTASGQSSTELERLNIISDPVDNAKGGIATFFMPSVNYWEADILRWSSERGLDPNLVATVMQIESCGDPKAQSYAGATGLFQVMPFHFAAGENAFDPETNALRGLAYLSSSLEAQAGNIRLGIAGYNAGIAGASRGEANWPDETVRYTNWGLGIYQEAAQGLTVSETLNNWLSRGGASLCQQASQRLDIQP